MVPYNTPECILSSHKCGYNLNCLITVLAAHVIARKQYVEQFIADNGRPNSIIVHEP